VDESGRKGLDNIAYGELAYANASDYHLDSILRQMRHVDGVRARLH